MKGEYLISGAVVLLSIGNQTGAMTTPLSRIQISSAFGSRTHPVRLIEHHHSGIDLRASIGEPIRAIGAGEVLFAGNLFNYGTFVTVRHGAKTTSHYAHCSKVFVKVGDRVVAGQTIALVGKSGNATGPHLHFEIRENGIALNPTQYVNDIFEGQRKGNL